MFPCSVVLLALDLHDVTVQCGSPVDNDPEDVFMFTCEPE